MTVFWDVAPCSLVEVTDVSEVLTASIFIALMMEVVSTSKTSVNFYQTTRHNIPEESSSAYFYISQAVCTIPFVYLLFLEPR
jgi:hypothetical protein